MTADLASFISFLALGFAVFVTLIILALALIPSLAERLGNKIRHEPTPPIPADKL